MVVFYMCCSKLINSLNYGSGIIQKKPDNFKKRPDSVEQCFHRVFFIHVGWFPSCNNRKNSRVEGESGHSYLLMADLLLYYRLWNPLHIFLCTVPWGPSLNISLYSLLCTLWFSLALCLSSFFLSAPLFISHPQPSIRLHIDNTYCLHFVILGYNMEHGIYSMWLHCETCRFYFLIFSTHL